MAEQLTWACAQAIVERLPATGPIAEELKALSAALASTYYANLSVFRSAPDTWAIEQLFPLMPIHRLDEQPTRLGHFADLTCDSDGKMDRFIDLHDVRQTLPVHPVRPGEPYYLGVFLVGAYQDVLGSNHNLFGQVGEAHVRVEEEGFAIERFVGGETAERVIEKMGFTARELMLGVERLVRQSRLSPVEKGAFLERYARELQGYTYLED